MYFKCLSYIFIKRIIFILTFKVVLIVNYLLSKNNQFFELQKKKSYKKTQNILYLPTTSSSITVNYFTTIITNDIKEVL